MKIIIKCTDGVMAGKEWYFNGSGQITLGRERGSMVTTAPEDNSISRHQCVIEVAPPNVYVSDAGSTHGTYVNGQLIGKKGQGGRCSVRDGAFIGVGSGGRTAVFQIRIMEEEHKVVPPSYGAGNRESYYNRNSNGQNIGSDFSAAFQGVFSQLKNIFAHPVRTAVEFSHMNNIMLGVVMILINMAVALILTTIVGISVKNNLGYFGSRISVGKIVIGVELIEVLEYFGLAGLLLLSTKVFFKAEITYAQILSFYGIQAMWKIAYLIVISLCAVLELGSIFVVVLSLGVIHIVLMGIFSYTEVVHLSPDKKMYAYFVFIILGFITFSIIIAIIGNDMFTSIIRSYDFFSQI